MCVREKMSDTYMFIYLKCDVCMDVCINIYLHFSCKLQRLNKLLWQLNEQKGTDVGVTIKINKRGKIMSEQNKKRETKTPS